MPSPFLCGDASCFVCGTYHDGIKATNGHHDFILTSIKYCKKEGGEKRKRSKGGNIQKKKRKTNKRITEEHEKGKKGKE